MHAAPQQEGTELAPEPERAARLCTQLPTPNSTLRDFLGDLRSPGELSLPRASLTVILPAPQRAEELKGAEENVYQAPACVRLPHDLGRQAVGTALGLALSWGLLLELWSAPLVILQWLELVTFKNLETGARVVAQR